MSWGRQAAMMTARTVEVHRSDREALFPHLVRPMVRQAVVRLTGVLARMI